MSCFCASWGDDVIFLFEMVSQTEQHKKMTGMEHEEKAFETCIFCFSPFDVFFLEVSILEKNTLRN